MMKITRQSLQKGKITQAAMAIEKAATWAKSPTAETLITQFRNRLQKTFPHSACPFTRHVPLWFFAGVFDEQGMSSYNGWVLLEVNHLCNLTEAEKVRSIVAKYPQTLFAMVGSSGRSVKFVVPYTRPDGSLPRTRIEAERFHAHAYRHAVQTYVPRISYPIALKEPILEQTCRASFDPEAYHNPSALAIHLEQPLELPTESLYQEQHPERRLEVKSTNDLLDEFRFQSIQYEMAFQEAVTANERKELFDFKSVLIDLGRICFKAGIAEESCVRWSISYFIRQIPETEIRETLHHLYQIESGFGKRALNQPDQEMALRTEEFMNRRYLFRHNMMTGGAEYRENNTFCFQYRPVTKRVMNSIALNAQKENLALWDRDVARYLDSDRIPLYYPVQDYLAHLPKWDGTDRIRELARRIPCDNPNWENLFYKWFLSMVAHWQGQDKQHGNSVSPLLVGPQGCGKSTFCLNLLPPELNAYYADSIDFAKKRDAELYLTRFCLINIDEFDQVSVAHQGFLKHLLQKPTVNVRKPYATQIEAQKRYASFIATSNHYDVLNDTSGSRRFICVEIKGIVDNGQPLEYAQLYAQATEALSKGTCYWMTAEEEKQQQLSNEFFRKRSYPEDLFHKYYHAASHEGEGVKLTAGEIYLSLQQKSKVKLPPNQVSVFGRFLKSSGLRHVKTKDGLLYCVIEN